MIAVVPWFKLNPEFHRGYVEFVGQEHTATDSPRGWDHEAVMLAAEFKRTDLVLEIGCAASYFLLYVSQFVKEAYGIDDLNGGGFGYVTKPWLDSLADFAEYRSGRVRVIDQNARWLPFPDDFFDVIFTVSALEHFAGRDDVLCVQEVRRTLRPGGSFLGTVDFNPVTEYPFQGNTICRTYTYRSLLDRIIKPSGMKLKGDDLVKDMPIPEAFPPLAATVFFHLVEEG